MCVYAPHAPRTNKQVHVTLRLHTYILRQVKKKRTRSDQLFFLPTRAKCTSVSQSVPNGRFCPDGGFRSAWDWSWIFLLFFFVFSSWGGVGLGGGGRAYWLGYIAYRGTNQQKRKERGRTSRCFGPSYLYLIEFNEWILPYMCVRVAIDASHDISLAITIPVHHNASPFSFPYFLLFSTESTNQQQPHASLGLCGSTPNLPSFVSEVYLLAGALARRAGARAAAAA